MRKIFYKKQTPKSIQYRNYKPFNEELFRIELDKELAQIDLNNAELTEFHNEFLPVLNNNVTLLRKAKRNYFAEIDNRIFKNRKFWKTVHPLFSEKAYQKESITIISKDTEETITKNEELAEILYSVVWLII